MQLQVNQTDRVISLITLLVTIIAISSKNFATCRAGTRQINTMLDSKVLGYEIKQKEMMHDVEYL